MPKARILTMPALPGASHLRRARTGDPRYLEGQLLLVDAIRYLVLTDAVGNLAAIELLSEHFRTKFRITDTPQPLQPRA
jgi:hypothetical protein